MSRTRVSEMPQRKSPRGPQPLRTSSSNSDPLHNRLTTDRRSPKLGDRRSPRGTQSDSVNQKKFGTRVSNLESQLGQAQEELKNLKEQLASAEEAKKEAQAKLEKKAKKPSAQGRPVEVQNNSTPNEIPDDNQRETDVFEVPMHKVKEEQPVDQPDEETKPIGMSTDSPPEPQKLTFDELALKNDEINTLKAMLEEKVKEVEVFHQENESLKSQLSEAALEMSKSRAKEEEMSLSLNDLGQQLEQSRANEVELREKLEVVEGKKDELESEMRKLRVQTEQWRKAADAAAAVLADGAETNRRRISERCGSMDKHLGNVFEPSVGGYTGFVGGSPGLGDDLDDGFGNGKRKGGGSGIRMFGDLWKKKGQK